MSGEPIMIATERLLLRPLRQDDAATVVALAGDYEVARMTSDLPHPIDEAQARRWLETARGEMRFAVEYGGEMIGGAGYFRTGSGIAELGFWLGRRWWGRGFATEAARVVLRHGFTHSRFKVFSSSHFVDNPASARVLAKLGFRRTGRTHMWSRARRIEVEAVCCQLDRKAARQSGLLDAEPAQRTRIWERLVRLADRRTKA